MIFNLFNRLKNIICLYLPTFSTILRSPNAISGNISEVCFPVYDKHCQDVILKYIENTEKMIHIAAYALSSKDIAYALQKKSDVWKYIVVDKFTSENWWGQNILGILKQSQKIIVYENVKPEVLMHNKFMVFDGKYVQTGSVNYSDAGFNKNFENIIILNSDELASRYVEYFDYILNTSKILFKKN